MILYILALLFATSYMAVVVGILRDCLHVVFYGFVFGSCSAAIFVILMWLEVANVSSNIP